MAVTYYVSNAGNDQNSGTSSDTPFATIARVNSQPLAGGDQVLFKARDVFSGSILLNMSTTTKPVTVSSYDGSSNYRAFIISGDETGITIYNIGGVLVSNLEFRGNSKTNNGVNAYVDKPNPGDPSHGRYTNIIIDNVIVSGYKFGISIGGGSDVGGFDNVQITNCIAHDNLEIGISTWGAYQDPTVHGHSHSNIYIVNCVAYLNKGNPAHDKGQTGNGIIISGCDGGLVEYCTAYNNGELNAHWGGGPVGIWTWEADSVIIQYCLAYNNSDGGKGADGGGFDIDGGATNCVIQYCYSYNNDGPGFEFAQFEGAHGWRNNTVRWSISQNDGKDNQHGINIYGSQSGPLAVQGAKNLWKHSDFEICSNWNIER